MSPPRFWYIFFYRFGRANRGEVVVNETIGRTPCFCWWVNKHYIRVSYTMIYYDMMGEYNTLLYKGTLCMVLLVALSMLELVCRALQGLQGEYTTFLASASRPWPCSWLRWWEIFLWLAWCLNYPLVMTNIAMEHHHFSWENPLFLWPFSIAILT